MSYPRHVSFALSFYMRGRNLFKGKSLSYYSETENMTGHINRPLAVLSEAFQPENLPHRSKEAELIEKQIKLFFNEGVCPDNLLLRGRTGTGKTGTLRHVLSKFPSEYYVFIQGQIVRTPVGVLQAILGKKHQTEHQLITEILNQLRFHPKAIVIDEAEKINKLNDLFVHLNTIHRETEVPVILATNYLAIRERMPDDAAETLLFKAVPFWEYNAEQLYDIVAARIQLLPKDYQKTIPDEALRYICARTAKEGEGNARRAREVMRKCLVEGRFDYPFVDAFFERVMTVDWDVIYGNFSRAERQFLHSLIEVTLERNGSEISFTDILKTTKLSRPRISNLLTFFEEQNVILARSINRGYPHGRTRRVRFASNDVFRRLTTLDEYGKPENAKDAEEIDVEALEKQTGLKL